VVFVLEPSLFLKMLFSFDRADEGIDFLKEQYYQLLQTLSSY